MIFKRKNKNKNILTYRVDSSYPNRIVHVAGIVVLYLGLSCIGICIAYIVFTYGIQIHTVRGNSMSPTVLENEQVFVNKAPASLHHVFKRDYIPKRLDIVVIQRSYRGVRENIVKRVIGLPGERVTIIDGVLTVYNAQSPTGFSPDAKIKNELELLPPAPPIDITLSDSSIFVVGDNRTEHGSFDSRNGLGDVPITNVIGTVVARTWPIQKLSPL